MLVSFFIFFFARPVVLWLREEGKNGTGGVFATPTEVELSKTVHACRATSTYEYASSKLLRDVPFLQAEPDSTYFHAGVARTQPSPFFPSLTTM